MNKNPFNYVKMTAPQKCSHFIGKRKEKRKTPPQKRKQKRKPEVTHVWNILFHIGFILFLYVLLAFLIVFDTVQMAQSERAVLT